MVNEVERHCLDALSCLTYPDGERCVPFRPIQDTTLYERRVVRVAIRALARKGFAEYFRGLTTEEGMFVGAGYCITKAGLAFNNGAIDNART